MEHFVQLRIELRVVRFDRSIRLISNSRLDMMCRIGWIPQEVSFSLSRIAMLEVPRLTISP
jgi:hypothetical protein